MNARQFFLALNDIDSRYLEEAESAVFTAGKRPATLRRLIPWAAAACLCLVLGAFLLWGAFAPVQTSVSSHVFGTLPETGSLPAAEELPKLVFSEYQSEFAPALAGPPEGSVTRGLTPEELASIWGQESLSWEGLFPLDLYLVESEVVVDPQGEVWQVKIWGYRAEEAKENYMDAFSIELRPDMLPPECMPPPEDAYEGCDVWGTPVRALTQGGGRGFGSPGESGSYYSDVTRYRTEFLREGEETVGVRAEATVDPLGLTGEEALDLLTRLTSQSLRPETQFSISQLAQSG